MITENKKINLLAKLIVILLACFITLYVDAAPLTFDSEISEVTVYRSGVRITRDAQINIPAGQSEVLFSNLATQINTHSLQVQVPEGVELVLAQYKTNFLKNAELPEKIKNINSEIATLQEELDWNNKQVQVYTKEEQLLVHKQVELSSFEKGLSVEDLKKYTDFYRERSLDISKKLFDFTNKNQGLQAKLTALRSELKEVQAQKNQKTGEVTFVIQSDIPRQCKLTFSFISNQAGWEPIYDLKAVDTDTPMELNLKANIYQNTGHDWENVKMSVSTGNPLASNDRPILSPQYITFGSVHKFRGQTNSGASNIYYNTMNQMNDSAELKNGEYKESTQPAQISETEITREYIIDRRQSIPSSGLKRLVQLQQYDIEAEYKYHAVPKLDGGVFLLAQVPNWGKYNLLPGTANIFFQNTYIGQSQINSNVSSKDILLSLGRDESIKIERERTNYMEETTFLGGNEIKNIEYTITVKNTKSKNVYIEVLDQIPIAQHEDIKIELEQSSKAKFDEKTGGLKWNVELSPGASKELVFKYSQKSPRNKPLAIK